MFFFVRLHCATVDVHIQVAQDARVAAVERYKSAAAKCVNIALSGLIVVSLLHCSVDYLFSAGMQLPRRQMLLPGRRPRRKLLRQQLLPVPTVLRPLSLRKPKLPPTRPPPPPRLPRLLQKRRSAPSVPLRPL